MSGLWDDELFALGERDLTPPKRKRVRHRALEARRFVSQYKKDKGCLFCKDSNPDHLDFHHIDPSTKKYNISQMVGWGMRIEVILDEIAKCQVLCSNCHRSVEQKRRETKS